MYPSTKNWLDYLQQIVFVEKPEFVWQPEYTITPALQERVHEITQFAIQHDLPVRHAFNMPLFAGHVVVPGPQRDWVFMPLDEDPLLNHPDGFPIPGAVLSQLQRIVDVGINVDQLFVAHEIAHGVIKRGQRATLEMLTPPPAKAMQRQASRYGTIAQIAYQAVTLPLAGAAALAGAGIALGAVAAIGAVGVGIGAGVLVAGALAGLDPILFGVFKDPTLPLQPGTPAAWIEMAHWEYDGA